MRGNGMDACIPIMADVPYRYFAEIDGVELDEYRDIHAACFSSPVSSSILTTFLHSQIQSVDVLPYVCAAPPI